MHPMSPARQFAANQPCTQCGKPLSRYNPYEVCGPCRVKLAPTLGLQPEGQAGDELEGLAWERFKRRPQIKAERT